MAENPARLRPGVPAIRDTLPSSPVLTGSPIQAESTTGEGDNLIEMSSGALQGAIREALALYLRRMDFDADGLAERWYPLGRERPVVLDPAISFGGARHHRHWCPY